MEAKYKYNPTHEGKPAYIKAFEDKPAEKGKYMILKGHGLARWKGMPETSTVQALDITKDTFSTFIQEVRGKTIKRVLALMGILYILFRKSLRKVGSEIIRIILIALHKQIKRYSPNP